MVGPGGLEPLTSSVSRKRSNQLSYGPVAASLARPRRCPGAARRVHSSAGRPFAGRERTLE